MSGNELANSIADGERTIPFVRSLSGVTLSPLCSVCQRHLDQMLTYKPHLKFIGAQYLTDEKIVGSVITEQSCAPSHNPHFRNDGLVSVNQA